MRSAKPFPLLAGPLAAALLAMPAVGTAQAPNGDIALRPDYRDGVHYTTVRRGGITEELYTAQAALEAARSGSPFPEGTVITMDDFRGGELTRILVMEKRAEWAGLSEAGDWLFREFAADGTPNASEDGARCAACHASQAANDYVFTRPRMQQ